MRILLTLILGLGLAQFANAQTRLSDLVQIQVLDGGRTSDGHHLAALRLTLKDGWKTYWRIPGEAGIPPSFSWSGSRNMDGVQIVWPAPKVFDQAGYRSVGYSDQLVLPLVLAPSTDGKPLRLKGEMDFGVCSDVCIPARLPFDMVLNPQADRNPAIAAAMAQQPFSAKEAGVKAASCTITPTQNGMQIETRITMPKGRGAETVIVEPGSPHIWASDMQSRRNGRTLVATGHMEHVDGKSFALNRSQMRITVLSQGQAVEINGCRAG